MKYFCSNLLEVNDHSASIKKNTITNSEYNTYIHTYIDCHNESLCIEILNKISFFLSKMEDKNINQVLSWGLVTVGGRRT
jgi:hypothetical protein